MRSNTLLFAWLLVSLGAPALAQERLSVADAVTRALAQNPAIRSTDAAAGEAATRVTQARAGYLPRVSLIQDAQRGNQPVYAFSSLLAARQFASTDFAISALNHPDAITSYHTGLAIEQPVFDGLRTQSATRSAELGRTLAETVQAQTREDLALNVTRAYAQVLLARAEGATATAAVTAAQEDLARAEHRRDAGLVSEADVLSLQVHLARMREREIRAGSEETVARAELNQAMGEPLDREFVLEEAGPATVAPAPMPELEQEALSARPEIKAADVQRARARENERGARGALLPQVSVQGLFDLNGSGTAFGTRSSAWLFGVQARWNVFSGMADIARLRETGLAAARATADRDSAEAAVRVEVRAAVARVQSAIARQQVGQAAVAQALESQRIIRDRYQAGMAPVTDVLRAADAVLDAQQQRTSAVVDLLVANAALDRALGRVPSNPQK